MDLKEFSMARVIVRAEDIIELADARPQTIELQAAIKKLERDVNAVYRVFSHTSDELKVSVHESTEDLFEENLRSLNPEYQREYGDDARDQLLKKKGLPPSLKPRGG